MTRKLTIGDLTFTCLTVAKSDEHEGLVAKIIIFGNRCFRTKFEFLTNCQ